MHSLLASSIHLQAMVVGSVPVGVGVTQLKMEPLTCEQTTVRKEEKQGSPKQVQLALCPPSLCLCSMTRCTTQACRWCLPGGGG